MTCPWTDEEISILKEKYPVVGSDIGLPSHSRDAVTHKANRLRIKISRSSLPDEETEQVILGSLFGDGSLIVLKNGRNALFREMHSLKQKEYLLWKKDKLSIFHIKVGQYSDYDDRTKKECHHIYIYTRVNEYLTKLHTDFYLSNKMLTYLNKLTSLGLAVWYMDDGCYNYNHRTPCFALGGFLRDEQNSIKEYFKEKWNFDSVLYRQSTTNCELFFARESADSFLSLVKPFIHPSLIYKLGHLSDENFEKLELARKRQRLTSKKHYQNHKQHYMEYNKTYQKNYYQKNKERKKALSKENYQKKREMKHGRGIC